MLREDEGCNYVICLGHLGIDDETAATGNRSIDLLNKVTGIDVFIDGHSHSTEEEIVEKTNTDRKVGDTILTSTGTKLENIGVVTIKDSTITTTCLSTEDMGAADDAIAARAAAIIAEIEAEYGKVFAKTEVTLNGEKDPGNRTQETNLGDLITDALVWGAEQQGETVDAAITNGGGIRATIEAGDITKKDVFTVLPFGNTLSIIKITGTELLEVLEASTFCTPELLLDALAGLEGERHRQHELDGLHHHRRPASWRRRRRIHVPSTLPHGGPFYVAGGRTPSAAGSSPRRTCSSCP